MAKVRHDNWSKSEVNGNFQTGCENNCRYCYAHSEGATKGWSKILTSWDKPAVRINSYRKKHKKYDTQVMCFGSHDITENNIITAIPIVRKLLDKDNKVVIVSKPRLSVIKQLCREFQGHKDKIVLRFTITTTNQALMSFWERNASSYKERKECLKYAYEEGWQTSVAVEPILDIDDADNLVAELVPFVKHSMWFGLMSNIDKNVKGNSPEIQAAKEKIKKDQVIDRIKALVLKHYLNSKIFWKNNIVAQLGWETPPEPAMDIAHVPKELKWLRWLNENREAEPEVGIERITGSNRVLVVAPHGFQGDGKREADDEMTGELAKLLAKKFGFYALINHKYKRVEHLNEADKSQYLVNCRSIEQIKKHLEEEFFLPFLAMVEEIKLKYGPPAIIHVHGIKDDRLLNEVKDKYASLLIGIGPLHDGKVNLKVKGKFPVYSFDYHTVGRFIKSIKPLGNIAEIAKKTKKFLGGRTDNINQYFRLPDSYDESVQSLQLEIKMVGCRESTENIAKLAEALGASLCELIGLVRANVPTIMPQPEKQPDEALVIEAGQTLSQIFSEHFERAMLEAGEYIIRTFYNDDYELARSKKPVKGESLRQLIIRLQGEPGAPKKSWLYNAVKIAIDARDFSGFHTYGKLQLSHKVALLPVDDMEQKKSLIEQAVGEELTVRELKEIIIASPKGRGSDQNPPQPAQKSLERLVDRPEVLFSEDYQSMIEPDELSRRHFSTLKKLTAQVDRKLAEIDDEMKRLQDVSDKYRGLLQTIESAKAKKEGVSS